MHDNYLDNWNIDGTNFVDTIKYNNSLHHWNVRNNTNHQIKMLVSNRQGKFTLGLAAAANQYLFGNLTTTTSFVETNVASIFYNYKITGSPENLVWQLPLNEILPIGVIIINVSCTINTDTVFTTSDATLHINASQGLNDSMTLAFGTDIIANTISLDTTHGQTNDYTIIASNLSEAKLNVDITNASAGIVTISNFFITFRW